MQSRPVWLPTVLLIAAIPGLAVVNPVSADEPAGIPAWLRAHLGEGDRQIALPVLARARALYQRRTGDGTVRNPCYFAMDATRPNVGDDDPSGGRFYMICEASQSFRIIAAGHGGGRNLKGIADFSNGRECAKNFGNAQDSNLTAGGNYLTSEIKTSFRGTYKVAPKQYEALMRSFVQFDGEGETANARQRAIGGHAAALVTGLCRRKDPTSPYADREGYVPTGKLVTYPGGRSDGCTSWSQANAKTVLPIIKDNPTTLYIYPESRDISATIKARAAGRSPQEGGAYWNQSCLQQIGAPKFWPRQTLEPIIEQYKKDHPQAPPKPLPICEDP